MSRKIALARTLSQEKRRRNVLRACLVFLYSSLQVNGLLDRLARAKGDGEREKVLGIFRQNFSPMNQKWLVRVSMTKSFSFFLPPALARAYCFVGCFMVYESSDSRRFRSVIPWMECGVYFTAPESVLKDAVVGLVFFVLDICLIGRRAHFGQRACPLIPPSPYNPE